MKWTPRDVIACLIIVGMLVLKIIGQDNAISWILLGVIGAYYGLDLSPWLKIGRNQGKKEED